MEVVIPSGGLCGKNLGLRNLCQYQKHNPPKACQIPEESHYQNHARNEIA